MSQPKESAVTSLPLVPEWATALFGEDADDVRGRAVKALIETHSLAMDAHRTARQQSYEAYGAARYQGQFERLVDRVGAIDGSRVVKPYGFRHRLVAVGRGIVYPFRYAEDLKKSVRQAQLRDPGETTRVLFSAFGTPPQWAQQELFPGPETSMPMVTDADLAEAKIVVVAYAMSRVGGLLAAYWGEGMLSADGLIAWANRGEPDLLPLLSAADMQEPMPDSQRRKLYIVGEPEPDKDNKPFDRQDEPGIDFPQRAPGSVPSSEEDQEDPEAEGYEQP
jgi:hypothetical protein